jgi:excisionase family DNA binding protein
VSDDLFEKLRQLFERLPGEGLPPRVLAIAALLATLVARDASREPEVIAEQLLRPQEVATALAVPVDHVYELCRRGVLPSVMIGKYRRVRRRDLDEWIRSMAQKQVDGDPYATYISRNGRSRAATTPQKRVLDATNAS